MVEANCQLPGGDERIPHVVVVVSVAAFNRSGDVLVRDLQFPYITHVRAMDLGPVRGRLTPDHVALLLAPISAAIAPKSLPADPRARPKASPTAAHGDVHEVIVVFAHQVGQKQRRAVSVANWQYEADYGCLLDAPATSQQNNPQPFDTPISDPAGTGFSKAVVVRARPLTVRSDRVLQRQGPLGGSKLGQVMKNSRQAVGL